MPKAANGEGSVYPEKIGGVETGKWIAAATVDVVNGKPRRSRKFFDSQRKAERGLAAMVAERDSGVVGSTATVKVYLEDYLENHLPRRKGGNLSPSTVENYRHSAKHIVQRIGNLRLDRVTPPVIENRLLGPMAEAGYSHSSVMRVRLVLSLAMAHAVRRGELSRNWAEESTIPATEAREPRKSLTREQVQSLVKACRAERMGTAIVTQLALGLRPGEVLGLQWSDLKGDVLHIQRAVKLEDGKLQFRHHENRSKQPTVTVARSPSRQPQASQGTPTGRAQAC